MPLITDRQRKWLIAAAIGTVALAAAALPFQQPPTSAQTNAGSASGTLSSGEELYKQHCLSCHAADGAGRGSNPALTTERFKKKYGTFEEAYGYISTEMPQNAPATLRNEDYEAIVNYVLSLNGIPTELSDIEAHWARDSILALHRKRAVDGYIEDGKLLYKPEQNITRAELITYLVKAKQLFLSNGSGPDITDIAKSPYKTYIATSIEYGIVDGYPDSTFRPDQEITRSEIAAILTRSEALDTSGQDGGTAAAFGDVEGHWAEGLIYAAVRAELFDGYDDGTFRPDRPITRAEAAAVIARVSP
ncbi:S-layer homology domain-containing protein [Paenibacillus oceani]|uniref:S-layer homology domain-containing protein n=1 Tax=Paenibacillus oceani TaxID=2772510 RepID=A0A927C9J5_9BACL|nr:S-layer homology domain-containing protein [Paenibacillus oceani]MBD2861971.1 S-layer homology domain-containing protein [Paenibacillus oceani]